MHYARRRVTVESDHLDYNWERARALAAIHEAGREIAASLDLDRTLRLVMTKAAETLPLDAGVLFVIDEPSRRYRVAVSHNIPPDKIDSITFAFDEGVPGGWCVIAGPCLWMMLAPIRVSTPSWSLRVCCPCWLFP